jgi:hypothetical protein
VGVLSPNDVRGEEDWPRSSDPTADSIEPPVVGGKPADDGTADPSAPTAPADDGSKIARPNERRAAHG